MSTRPRKRGDRTAQLWGQCRRKLRYRTIEAVERRRLERQAATGVALTFYVCPHCGCYHLTKDRAA